MVIMILSLLFKADKNSIFGAIIYCFLNYPTNSQTNFSKRDVTFSSFTHKYSINLLT